MKNNFLNNLELLFSNREKILYNFKNRLFQTKKDKIRRLKPTLESTPELAPEATKHKKSKLKLQEQFINEIIVNEIYVKKYFGVILNNRIHRL